MGWAMPLVILALLLGVVGLLFKGLKWLIIIALVLLLIGASRGSRRRRPRL